MFKWNDVKFPSSGSWFRAMLTSPWSFEETVARLVTLTGQPAKSGDDYKTSVDFRGEFNGQYFSLYDYKEDREIHIGGDNSLSVEALQSELLTALERVEPTPYSAAEYYDALAGHQWP